METDKLDRALRPQSLADFTGQKQVAENLQVFIAGAKDRGEPLEHLLFCGGPGLGKTTLAGVVASEMSSRLVTVNAPSIKTKAEMAKILLSLEHGDILFLDEIHRLKAEIQEILYPVMEDFKLEIAQGEGTLRLDLMPFTLIGATTHMGLISAPMRDRFGDVCTLVPYTTVELEAVITRSAIMLNMVLEASAIREIAQRSRSTPRVALKLLRRMRDYAAFQNTWLVTHQMTKDSFQKLGIDQLGLDQTSRKLLGLLIEKGRPVGLNTLASLLGEQVQNIEEAIEPFLLAQGFIEKMPGGRVATDKARKHLAA